MVYGVGGIAGFAGGDIINCHNVSTKVVSRDGMAGGIIGSSTDINIRQSTNSGEVISKTSNKAGGIIAHLSLLGGRTRL